MTRSLLCKESVYSFIKLINIPKKRNYTCDKGSKIKQCYVYNVSINYSSECFSRTSSQYHIRFCFLSSYELKLRDDGNNDRGLINTLQQIYNLCHFSFVKESNQNIIFALCNIAQIAEREKGLHHFFFLLQYQQYHQPTKKCISKPQ